MSPSNVSRATRIAAIGGAMALVTAGVAGFRVPAAVTAKAPLTIIANAQGTYTRNFNPFTAGSITNDTDLIYEPLLYYDVPAGRIIPWLASSYRWLPGNQSVVIALRHDVTFTNGTRLTSADVTFTFAMLKKYPSMDLNGVWKVLKSVTAQGPYAVKFTFDKPETPFLYFVAGQTPIVPKSIWSKIANPSTWADPNPVGSGPFTLKSFSPQLVAYARNPHYWGTKPAVPEVLIPQFTSNTSELLALARGEGDLGGVAIPNPTKDFVAKNPKHFFYYNFPARSDANFYALYPNDAIKPFNQVVFRRAIYYALNRKEIGVVATDSGVASPTSLLVPPTEYLPKSTVAKWSYKFNPKQALKLLHTLGYHMSGTHLIGPQGGRVSFSLTVPSSFTSWVAVADVVKANLAKIGINVSLNLLSPGDVFNDQALGKYQLTINGGTGGASAWFQYYYDYSTATSAPLGKPAPFNFERYDNASMNHYINAYAQTSSRSQQHSDIAHLALLSAEQLPIFPLTIMPSGEEITTLRYTNWPTPKNPYAMPSPFFYPDTMAVLLHVKPVK